MVAKGQISFEESIFLRELVNRITSDGPIIEIGTLFGFSTLCLCRSKSADRALITVDNYSWNPLDMLPDDHYLTTKSILNEAIEKYNVIQLRDDKNHFYATYNSSTPSLVFIDAIHTYKETKKDIAWARRVKAEIICGHDYSYPGVAKAVEEAGGYGECRGSIWVL